jgi:hypothetical protein
LDVTVYVIVQLKMNDRAAYDRYQRALLRGTSFNEPVPDSVNTLLRAGW